MKFTPEQAKILSRQASEIADLMTRQNNEREELKETHLEELKAAGLEPPKTPEQGN